MSEISEKLKGLKFMQKVDKGKGVEVEESFSTYFCRKGVFSYNSKQKIRDRENDVQKKLRNRVV